MSVCDTLWPPTPHPLAPSESSSMRRVIFTQIYVPEWQAGCSYVDSRCGFAKLRNMTPKLQAGHKSIMGRGVAPLIWPFIKCVKLYYCPLFTRVSHYLEHRSCLFVTKAAGAEMWLPAIRICNVFAFTHPMWLCNCYVQAYTFLRTGWQGRDYGHPFMPSVCAA